MRNSRLLAAGLLALMSLVGCGGVVDEPTEASSLGMSEAALSAGPEQGQEDQGRPCLTTADCPNTGFFVCSTEEGVCNPPPGCNPEREVCPAVCYGTCELVSTPPPSKRCGEVVCPQGTRCCNPLQSICVPPGFACIF